MATKLYCTQCGKEIGRRPDCPYCNAPSEYWNIESPHLSASHGEDGQVPSGRTAAEEEERAAPTEEDAVEEPSDEAPGDAETRMTSWFNATGEHDDEEEAYALRLLKAAPPGAPAKASPGNTMTLPPADKGGRPNATMTLGVEDGPRVLVAALLKAGEAQDAAYPVYEGKNFLGKGSGNDIVIDDGYVSEVHAVLVCSRAGDKVAFKLTDKGSKNGTYVNGAKLQAKQAKDLQLGANIRLGKTELRLEPADNSAATS
ncbi:MAG: FHA domain-containing protein [Planctomycetes bacterium]|nr:FHA domain-containing protein [Planctomycetota bacterium]